MPKVNLVEGQPCPDCGTPAIIGKKGAYCKPCYIKWKNSQEALQPAVGGFHPQTAQNAAQVNSGAYRPITDNSANIRQFQENKQEGMRVSSSGRDAVLITVAQMAQGGAWTDEMVAASIEKWRKYFFEKIYSDKPF